jgi:hypothetical protein
VWELTRALTRSTAKHDILLQELLPLLDLRPESKLQREIRDIIDELDIMLYIVKQQHEIIGHFKTNAVEILTSERNKKENGGREDQDRLVSEEYLFQKRANGILKDVCWQVSELGSLKESAVSTAQSVRITNDCNNEIFNEIQVDELISFKQQQAGVVQACQATKQGQETAMQGKAIMVFTVMTIIFVSTVFLICMTPNHTSDLLVTAIIHVKSLRYERSGANRIERHYARRSFPAIDKFLAHGFQAPDFHYV